MSGAREDVVVWMIGRGRRVAGCLVVLVWAGGCTSNEDVPSLPDGGISETATTVEQRDERDAVVEAYDRFWPRLTDASAQAEENDWQATLAEVAVEAQLSRSVAGIRQMRGQSKKIYGSVSARIVAVEVSGDQARLTDCQDASRSGQADATTGDPKTVGVERNPVSATLVRGGDGVWRVAEIVYPGGTC